MITLKRSPRANAAAAASIPMANMTSPIFVAESRLPPEFFFMAVKTRNLQDLKNIARCDLSDTKIKIGRAKLGFEIRQKIAQRAAKGQTPFAIAKALGIDRRTAGKYVRNEVPD
jgi:hypothetical protein